MGKTQRLGTYAILKLVLGIRDGSKPRSASITYLHLRGNREGACPHHGVEECIEIEVRLSEKDGSQNVVMVRAKGEYSLWKGWDLQKGWETLAHTIYGDHEIIVGTGWDIEYVPLTVKPE